MPAGRRRQHELDSIAVRQFGREQRLFPAHFLVGAGRDLAREFEQHVCGEVFCGVSLHVRLALPGDPDLGRTVDGNFGDRIGLKPALERLEMRAQRGAAPYFGLLCLDDVQRQCTGVHGSTSSIRSRPAAMSGQKSRSRFRKTLMRSPCATVLVGGMLA